MAIKLPRWSKPLFKPFRYKTLYGGRGSAKSYTVAKVLLLLGVQKKILVLCAREYQNSIADSVHKLLVEQIDVLGLHSEYTYTNTEIVGKNGTQFIFKGVKTNVQSIKSMVGITHLWVEEAQTVSKESLEILIPTIREPESEIWFTFNPLNEDDPVYKMFVDERGEPNGREETFCLKVNHKDNPWFPQVLRTEMEHCFATDPDLAEHIWNGGCKLNSDAQIMKGKYEVRAFEVPKKLDHNKTEVIAWNGPYFGADWGFSRDPNTLIKFYLDFEAQILYIRNEFYERGVDTEDLPPKWDRIPDSRTTTIRADNSRPETISYMVKKGFRVEAAKKWSGSVEDGIAFIRSFRKIVIHPDCPQTALEAKKYSFKVDRLTGDVTTTIVDDWNHCFDAIRYGLDPLITSGTSILDVL